MWLRSSGVRQRFYGQTCHSNDLHVGAIQNFSIPPIISVGLSILSFGVLAVVLKSFTAVIRVIVMVIDSTMVRRLVAVVGPSIVSATTMDIEMVDTVGGSGGRGVLHAAGGGRRAQN